MNPRNESTDDDRSEMARATSEIANRLTSRGVRVTPADQPEQLVDMLDAIERFEQAVEARGGDLMMDESAKGRAEEPDDPHFALPVRREHESVSRYLERLARATDDVLRHPRRAD
jgi:hypothetical protein